MDTGIVVPSNLPLDTASMLKLYVPGGIRGDWRMISSPAHARQSNYYTDSLNTE